jgi:serine/threonine protein kinase
MALQLLVIAGADKDHVLTLHPGPEQMLGRSPTAMYRLSDLRVSRNHAEVQLKGDQVTIVDNGGSGGVLVNGTAVKSQVLKLGDVVKVGDTELRLQIGDYSVKDAVEMANRSPAPPPAPDKAPGVGKLADLAGKTLSHYEIGHEIGQGATSMVFFANDPQNGNRPVALKVLLPEFSTNEEELQRFIRAMKTMMPLRHPNLVTLYGAGKTGKYCWVAMEFVAGEVLTETIKRLGVLGQLDWRNAHRVALHVARALEYAHGHQIIHRGVRPQNILIQATDKISKLSDLMLAKAIEGSMAKEEITRPGELIGDVLYMSPERTRGNPDEIDARSDLYGLGATVYALLTGRPPFEGTNLIEKITKIRQSEPVKPTKYQLSIPHRFETLVLRLLAKQPEDRPQTAAEVVKELDMIGRMHSLKE